MGAITAIPEHSVMVLLVQFALILGAARLLGELAQRLGQPPVLGELLAGILLGHTVLGRWAPELQGRLFPPDQLGFHLLEMVSWLGLVFLLFLVGLEIDVKVLRRLGKPAFNIVAFGFTLTFVSGYALGLYLPGHLMGPLKDRSVLALFMGVAMSVTAVPVLGKILLDLDLLKRDVGVAALGAGLVEDLIGWVALSVVLDMAHRGSGDPRTAAISLSVTLVFLGAAWLAGRPAVLWLLRAADRLLRAPHRRVTAAALVMLTGAAVTQAIGIHAVFGAFVAGVLVGQSPRFTAEDRHALETLAFGVFSPVFFSFAGLQLRLHELGEWDLLSVVLAVAVAGKVFGGYVGGRIGGFSAPASVALGVGMNARGAMELVLALLGLSAGIISSELYSIVVMMAVLTTLMTPPLLRAVMRFVPLSSDEAERLASQARAASSVFTGRELKALVPTAGGPSAAGLLSFLGPLATAKRLEPSFLMVREPGKSLKEKLTRALGWDPLSMDFHAAAEELKRRAEGFGVSLAPRIVTRDSRETAVLEEAERGYSLLFLGTHTPEDPLGGAFLAEAVAESPCHVALFRAGLSPAPGPFTRILLPTKGDPLFPFVFEFAALYAEAVPECSLTVLNATPDRKGGWNPFSLLGESAPPAAGSGMAPLVAEALQSHAQTAGGKALRVEQKTVHDGAPSEAILREASAGRHDLILLAGVKSLVRERLFFGHTIAELLRRAPCPVLVLTPARGGFGALAR